MTREKRHMILRILVIIALVLAVVDVVLLLTKSSKRVVTENEILSYSENSNINYQVISKEEGENGKIPLNEPFIKDNISSIETTFNYSFLGDKELDFEYTESVVAILTSRDLRGNKIFSKEYVLSNEKEGKIEDNTGFNINKKVTIDYNLYTEIINNYFLEKSIDPANTKTELVVNLNVKTSTEIEEEKIESKTITKLNVPINVDEFKINEEIVNNDKKVIDKISEVVKNDTLISSLYTLYGIAVSILIIVFINYFMNRDYVNSYKSEYKKVRKMVREYEEIIVHTYEMPDLSDKILTNIDRFDVFIAISDKYDLGISMVDKDDFITFVMINDDKAWIYTIDKQ
ncbi:MAG: DUF5305 family protein [Bacilli bacterium]